jgi:hypothetical protein
MLHDTLFVLLGHRSDALDSAMLSDADKKALAPFVKLGALYASISLFVRQKQASSSSLYVSALCIGIECYLNAYRAAIVDLEDQCLRDPTLALTDLLHTLRDYAQVLPTMHGVVQRIQADDICGGAVLTAVFEASRSGYPTVQMEMQRLQQHCHKIFYNHIFAWVAYGSLSDDHDEFFIRRSDSAEPVLHPPDIPSYVPAQLGTVILFVGAAVQVRGYASYVFVACSCKF